MSNVTCALRRAACLLLGLLAASWFYVSPVRADADDIVFLRNGGRARGVVIEADPSTGARVRLQDGTVRKFEAASIDHIAYGVPAPGLQPVAAAPPPPITPPSAAAPTWGGGESSAFLGAVRVESSEPGEVFVEGGEYGPMPVVIPNLSAGPHRISVRFNAGDDDTRTVVVRGGAETVVRFEAPASLRSFRALQGIHLGGGMDGGFGLIDGEEAAPGFRVFVRGAYIVSRKFELHADARFGMFPAAYGADEYYDYYYTEEGLFGFALRMDAQLNLSSIFSMYIGLDAGVVTKAGVFAGGHISPLAFRMGSERRFMLALQAGVLSGEEAIADFSLVLSYLFL